VDVVNIIREKRKKICWRGGNIMVLRPIFRPVDPYVAAFLPFSALFLSLC
jgi:hypothetical protein